MARKILIDCDTGIDDALALYYAARQPELELLAVTCVSGNTDVEIAAENSLAVLELAGRGDVPVALGAGRSLLTPFVRSADFVHGTNGLGGVVLPAPRGSPVSIHAADFIIDTVKAAPGEVTLCAVAPLTNVALALAKAPEIAGLMREIVTMGSTLVHPGIHRVAPPMADANWLNDPEAAQIVLQSGAPLTVVGMDVTMRAILSPAAMAAIRAEGPAAAGTLMDATEFYAGAYAGMYPDLGGCALHDPLAVACVHAPELLTLEPMRLDVELAGRLSRGQAIPDRRPGVTPNCRVAIALDAPEFLRRFHSALTAL